MSRSEETGVTPVRDRSALAVGPVRRRRFSTEQKKEILAAASSGQTTVSAVARHYGLTRSLIHNWRRQEAASLLGATVRFTPVTVGSQKAEATKVTRGRRGRIEIELPGEVRVRLEGPVDEADLQRVVRALRR
jgi:transposase